MIPILFNTEMVKAILEGRKTVTRRVIKPPRGADDIFGHLKEVRQPCVIGDILYVRETFTQVAEHIFWYRATPPKRCENILWKPSIHMPKEAARLFLKVTDVRVERVQDITSDDAISEGVSMDRAYELNNWTPTFYDPDSGGDPDYIEAFKELWDSTVDKTVKDRYGWEANPWVWVIEFEKIQTMLDDLHDFLMND